MAKMTTLKHKLPCGTVVTRKTAREYSHVVIGRRDAAALREARNVISKQDLGNYAYFRKHLEIGVGNSYPLSSQFDHVVTQGEYNKALAVLEGCSNAQEYAEKSRAARLAKHDAEWGDKVAGEWFVAGWCGRPDLADKLVATQRSAAYCNRDMQAVAINNGI